EPPLLLGSHLDVPGDLDAPAVTGSMRPSVYSARYDTVAITLHWAIAALIVLDFLLAMSFSQFNPGDALYFRDAYSLHMSRSEERRVGKECRYRWVTYHEKKE